MLNKAKATNRRGKIVLMNASQRFEKGQPKNYLTIDVIAPLAAAFLGGEEASREVAVVTTEQVKSADYNVSPSRWVANEGLDSNPNLASLVEAFEGLVAQTRRWRPPCHGCCRRSRALNAYHQRMGKACIARAYASDITLESDHPTKNGKLYRRIGCFARNPPRCV